MSAFNLTHKIELLKGATVPTMAVGWMEQLACPCFIDVDYVLNIQNIRGEDMGKSHYMSAHRGAVWVSDRSPNNRSKLTIIL